MAWERGITVIPGLRIIPDSRYYRVRDEHVDMVLGHRGKEIRCCIVSKFDAEAMKCLSLHALASRIRDVVLVESDYAIDVHTVTFTGNFHFPLMTLKRFTNEFDIWALGECVTWQ